MKRKKPTKINWKLVNLLILSTVILSYAIFSLNLSSHILTSPFLINGDYSFSSSSINDDDDYSPKKKTTDSVMRQQRYIHSCPNTETTRQQRWSDRESQNPSGIKSLFNCFLPDSKCQYYYPANFFDPNCGIGKDYLPLVYDMQQRHEEGTLWKNMPQVGIPLVTFNHLCYSKEDIQNQKLSRGYGLGQKGPKGSRNIFDKQGPSAFTERRQEFRDQRKAKKGRKEKLKFDRQWRRRLMLLPDTFKRKQGEKSLKYARLTDIGQYIKRGNNQTQSCLTERFSFIHVHKNGGTSIRDNFAALVKSHPSQASVERNFIVDHRNSMIRKRELDSGKLVSGKLGTGAMELVQHATHYPVKEYEPQQVVFVTTVRDPLSRFISAIGQALGGPGSTNNVIGKVLREECVHTNSQESLRCLARYVQTHGFWIELHFTPQAMEISFATRYKDVPVAVFQFPNHMGDLLEYMGGSAERKQRDGSKEGYRSDPILTNMSVADYDDDILKIVCRIYEMDVIMLRSLGIEVPKCDTYV